ncbi:DUF5666 domain-containing protein [Marinobacter orientalis]|uniref:DUF5666 domain-containing protein n=1 Tax=Marinobacter orientalis TaxID=1928859 RepID=A0A7Y0RAY6_9GAMM|nr:DUF5666 domain-containing protein [Marinobacter orientalis]NMT61996.1 hypothetical protein [Marinobacter orientalis]TGX50724.1 hypothetical protein DIT72_01400 [Marinobacter orientalis]
MKRMTIQSTIGFALSALAVSILTACGGGGSGASIDITDGGIRGTGSSVGPVSGFGSVFVNGVRFDTGGLNGQVQSDDGIAAESELEEGMILRIDGEWQDDGTGTANVVEYDDTLRGEVESVAPDGSGAGGYVELVVMGQTVIIEKQTVVNGTTFANLLAGNGTGLNVRVSAWRQADGSFRASYVGVLTRNTKADVELEGVIEEGSVQQGSFTIGDIEVTYDASTVVFGEGLGVSDLVAGRFFEVEGDYSTGTLQAREIERDDFRRYGRNTDADIEFTSIIQDPFSPDGSGSQQGTFVISGLIVRVTDDTGLDDDLAVSDLQQGILVQVEGEFTGARTILAEEITLREANAEVTGVITSVVDRTAGTFEVGGVWVQVTSFTIITDNDNDSRTSLENLFAGDQVEVEGVEREDSSGRIFLEALKIEREESEDDGEEQREFELEGKLRGIDDLSITVLGVRMTADASAFDDDAPRWEIEQLVNPVTGEFPVVEVDYLPVVVGQYPYEATDIELEENEDD